MNFNSLSNQTMLSHSDEWLNDPETRGLLAAHPLTTALLPEVQRAHDGLAEKQGTRNRIFAELGQITGDLLAYDLVHDRKARGMHSLLSGLAECLEDADEASRFVDLLARLFPYGLSVVNRSYIDEAGAVVEMQSRITDQDLAFMASVRVGEQTLATIYRDWLAAGAMLGRQARQRARLQQAIRKQGTAAADIDTRGARQQWIWSAGTLVSIVNMLDFSHAARERLLAPLQRSIEDAARGRSGTGAGADDVPDDVLGDRPDDGLGDLSGDEAGDVAGDVPAGELVDDVVASGDVGGDLVAAGALER